VALRWASEQTTREAGINASQNELGRSLES